MLAHAALLESINGTAMNSPRINTAKFIPNTNNSPEIKSFVFCVVILPPINILYLSNGMMRPSGWAMWTHSLQIHAGQTVTSYYHASHHPVYHYPVWFYGA